MFAVREMVINFLTVFAILFRGENPAVHGGEDVTYRFVLDS